MERKSIFLETAVADLWLRVMLPSINTAGCIKTVFYVIECFLSQARQPEDVCSGQTDRDGTQQSTCQDTVRTAGSAC